MGGPGCWGGPVGPGGSGCPGCPGCPGSPGGSRKYGRSSMHLMHTGPNRRLECFGISVNKV